MLANQKSKTTNLKSPSPRDLEIYQRVRLRNHPQWEVASDHGIHRTRVSQIVRRVNRWLAAGGSPTDPKFKNLLDQRRLNGSLQKLRLLRAVEIAAAYLEGPVEPIKRTRSRTVGGVEVWREESTADTSSTRLFALQNYLTAVKALHDFQHRGEPRAEPEPIAPEAALPNLLELLCRFRFQSKSAGHVESARDVRALVLATLQQLLGPIAMPTAQATARPTSGAVATPSGTTEQSAHLALTVSDAPNTADAASSGPSQTSNDCPPSESRGGGPEVSDQRQNHDSMLPHHLYCG